jgi:hypothetical protein
MLYGFDAEPRSDTIPAMRQELQVHRAQKKIAMLVYNEKIGGEVPQRLLPIH